MEKFEMMITNPIGEISFEMFDSKEDMYNRADELESKHPDYDCVILNNGEAVFKAIETYELPF